MRWLLLLAIRCYWALWPARWRRGCLYRESCSRHVYRMAQQGGFAKGFRALRGRFRTCRPAYGIVAGYGETWLVLADGSFLPAAEAALAVLGAGRQEASSTPLTAATPYISGNGGTSAGRRHLPSASAVIPRKGA